MNILLQKISRDELNHIAAATFANLWGINLYPEASRDDFIEFDSMINVRPSAGNRSRGVQDELVRKKIVEVIAKWIHP